MKNATIAIIIPAHNEAATIYKVVADALQYCEHIIVVDDGSTDGSAESIKDLPVSVIQHPTNLGKSQALLTGFKAALEHDISAVITIDADAQHQATMIPEFIGCAEQNPQQLILGARILGKEARPKKNLIGNKIADFFITWAGNQVVHDTQSGFRFYPKSFLEKINLNKKFKFSFTLESFLLIQAANLNYKVISLPIETIYTKSMRLSHYHPWKDTLPIITMISWQIIKKGMNIPGFIKAYKNFKM